MLELETLFSMASTVAAFSWLALAVTPLTWSWPARLGRAAALGLSLLYVALIVSFWSGGEGGFDSLASVASLFETRGLLLAGWVHYLAFDLFVGIWERGESLRVGLSRWLLIPCLFLTFMFGPAGWLAFMAARRSKERSPR